MRLITVLACLYLMFEQSWSAMYPDPDCGKSLTPRIPKFIAGGEVASEGQFPWVVSIQWKPIRLHNCSGSIISADVILTSAYCLKGRRTSHAVIRAGLIDLSNIRGYTQTRYAKRFILHEHFDRFNNDIGLIKLTRPFDYKKSKGRIGAICISKQMTVEEGKILEVAGWGWKGPHETYASLLMAGLVTVRLHTLCAVLDNDYNATIMFCSYDEDKNACKGDTGSAAIVNELLYPAYQLGIVSFGDGCRTLPAYYVRLSFYYDWIDKWMYNLNDSDELM